MPENASVETANERLLVAHAVSLLAFSVRQFHTYLPVVMLVTVNDAGELGAVLPVCAHVPEMFVYNFIEERETLSDAEQVKIIVVWFVVLLSFGSLNVTVGAAVTIGINTRTKNSIHLFCIEIQREALLKYLFVFGHSQPE